jgi:transposase-like protein
LREAWTSPLRQDTSLEREDVHIEDRQRRKRRQFTAEFKRDAVELVRSTGRPIAEIARELGIYDSTLGNWVRQDRSTGARPRG